MSIPSTFHFIWFSPTPPTNMPVLYQHCIDSWSKIHSDPKYKMKIWGDNDITPEEFPLTFQWKSLFPNTPLAQLADVFRYEILYHQGGIYCDADLECLQSIEPLLKLHKTRHLFLCCNESDDPNVDYCTNAWFSCTPKNPILKRILDKIQKMIENESETQKMLQKRGPNEVTGPFLLGWALQRRAEEKEDNVIIKFPKVYFYPYLWFEKIEGYEKSWPESFAKHCWAESWK